MYDYLIIGNGIAGLSACEEIRKKDSDAKILIVSAEKPSTYWRTRLSDLISKDFNDDDLYVKKEPWYSEKHIDEKLQTAVTKLDTANNKAILETGEEIEYGKCLLATGAHPFIPPIKNIDSQGVFAIRTVDDLWAFKDYVEGKEKVVVIGGGILGLEAAYSAMLLGKKVTVIESFDYLLSRQLDRELSALFEKSLNKMGIETMTGKNTEEIIVEDGIVAGVRLANGVEIAADAILVQAGVRSNLEVAENSGLATERGIIVNDNLQTEVDNVFAAGDCAQIGDFTIGLWTSSQEMGRIAGHNMTGSDEHYEKPKPFSTLMIGDTKIFSAGITSGNDITEIKRELDGNIYKIFRQNGKTVGGILWGDIKYQNDIKDAVFYGKDIRETKLYEFLFDEM